MKNKIVYIYKLNLQNYLTLEGLMIVVNAIMKTNDNNFETIKNAVKELEIKTREEDGCLDYAFSVELHSDRIIRITELWENLQSLKDHLKTEHVAHFVGSLSDDPPETDAKFYEANQIDYPG